MAKQHTREACMLMELLLLVWACGQPQHQNGVAAAGPSAQPWPPPRFQHLAEIVHRHLLASFRPPELLQGPEGQRVDYLVRGCAGVGASSNF